MNVRLLGVGAAVMSVMFAAPPARGGEGPKVGEALPPIAAVDAAGDAYDVEKSLKGKAVLLTFWTLDPKSLSGMPLERLGKLSQEFADDERFHIVTVCVNDMGDWDAWSAFWLQGKEHKVPRFGTPHWWVLMHCDPEEPTTAQRYGVADTPAYYLIGGDGRLAGVRVPPEELQGAVSRLLKQMPRGEGGRP